MISTDLSPGKIIPYCRNLLKSEFFSNTAVLTSGTTLTQVISVITAPIVLRIYTPDDYGILGLFMMTSGLIGSFASLQYHNAIVITDRDEDALSLCGLVFLTTLIVSLLAAIIAFFFRKTVYTLLGNDSIGLWLYLAPISILFSGIYLILSSLAVRHKKFHMLSVNKVIAAILAPIISIPLGLLYAGPMGLFVGLLISQVVPALLLFWNFRAEGMLWTLDKERMAHLLRRYKNFPRYSLPSEFINYFSNQMPIIMLSNTAGTAAVGFFNLTNRLLAMPIQLISASVLEVFKQRASSDYSQSGTCRPVFMKVFKMLLAISVIPFLILMLLGPEIFSFFFGAQWRESGILAQILGILFIFKFVVSPLTYVTYIADKQWIGLLTDILLLAVVSLIFYLTHLLQLPYKTSLLIYALSYSSLYFITFAISYRLSENRRHAEENL